MGSIFENVQKSTTFGDGICTFLEWLVKKISHKKVSKNDFFIKIDSKVIKKSATSWISGKMRFFLGFWISVGRNTVVPRIIFRNISHLWKISTSILIIPSDHIPEYNKFCEILCSLFRNIKWILLVIFKAVFSKRNIKWIQLVFLKQFLKNGI